MREDIPGYKERVFLAIIVEGGSRLGCRGRVELVFNDLEAVITVLRKSFRASAVRVGRGHCVGQTKDAETVSTKKGYRI